MSKLGLLIFGMDPKLRMRVQRSMISTLIYVVWMLLEAYAAHANIIPWDAAYLMMGYNVAGLLAFYILLRSGLSLRMRDPSLTLAQETYAIGALMIAYVLVPPTRAAVLQCMGLTLAFGMFTLKPRENVYACAATVGLLLATLTAMWVIQPPHFNLKRETINALLACIVLPSLTVIIRHFAVMREHLLAQRAELKEAVARVEQLATRDSLTGLFNRRHALAVMDQEQRRHQRSTAPLTVALIDLDHFKRINDSLGHGVGDEVLQAFARHAMQVMRQTDVVARWGGEEFLIVFPESSAAEAQRGLARLREHLSAQHLSAAAPELTVTFSAGVAAITPDDTVEQCLERADRALYAAKAAGRDCCVVDDAAGQLAQQLQAAQLTAEVA